MESAREFAEQYFDDSSGACDSLAKHIQARDAAIRAECAERAAKHVKLWADMGGRLVPINVDYATLQIRAAIMGGKP